MIKPMILALCTVMASSAVEARDSDPVKVSSAKPFKGAQNIVIGSFSIGFLTEKTDSAFAGKRGYGGSSVAKTRLEGVDAAQFQAITDAAYADFVAKLTAAGYVVADRAAMVATPGFAKLKYLPSGSEGGITFGKDAKSRARFFGPSSFGATPLFAGETGNGMFSGFGAMGPAMARGTYAMQSKQPIVNVAYVIDYASADHYGGFFAMSSSVKVKAQLAVAETLSTVTMVDARAMLGTLALADPIAVGGDFGTLRDSTTRGQKLDNVLGNVIGILGGVGTSSRKFFTFDALPEQYRLGATEATTRANTTMVTRLVTLR